MVAWGCWEGERGRGGGEAPAGASTAAAVRKYRGGGVKGRGRRERLLLERALLRQ